MASTTLGAGTTPGAAAGTLGIALGEVAGMLGTNLIGAAAGTNLIGVATGCAPLYIVREVAAYLREATCSTIPKTIPATMFKMPIASVPMLPVIEMGRLVAAALSATVVEQETEPAIIIRSEATLPTIRLTQAATTTVALSKDVITPGCFIIAIRTIITKIATAKEAAIRIIPTIAILLMAIPADAAVPQTPLTTSQTTPLPAPVAIVPRGVVAVDVAAEAVVAEAVAGAVALKTASTL